MTASTTSTSNQRVVTANAGVMLGGIAVQDNDLNRRMDGAINLVRAAGAVATLETP